jgi:hypothetical protein
MFRSATPIYLFIFFCFTVFIFYDLCICADLESIRVFFFALAWKTACEGRQVSISHRNLEKVPKSFPFFNYPYIRLIVNGTWKGGFDSTHPMYMSPPFANGHHE